MKTASIFVRAFWDDDAKVWVATSNDIAGLSVEGETHEELTDKVVAAVTDLIEAQRNRDGPSGDSSPHHDG